MATNPPKELRAEDIKTDAERADEQRVQREREQQREQEQAKADKQRAGRRGSDPNTVDGEKPRDSAEQAGTPEGAGRKYDERPSGSQNHMGKASATRAGGDPVHSPVIGNPGEHNPAAGGYDYAMAGSTRQASAPLRSSDVADPAARGTVDEGEEKVEYARRVVAFKKGDYNGVKEVGEEFDNDRNLPTYPEDPDAWFQAADEGERKASEGRAQEIRKAKRERQQRLQDENERIARERSGR